MLGYHVVQRVVQTERRILYRRGDCVMVFTGQKLVRNGMIRTMRTFAGRAFEGRRGWRTGRWRTRRQGETMRPRRASCGCRFGFDTFTAF